MRLRTSLFAIALASLWANADTLQINSFKYSGPVPMLKPLAVGDTSKLVARDLDMPLRHQDATARIVQIDSIAPGYADAQAMHLLSFDFENRKFGKADLKIEGFADYEVYLDKKKSSAGPLKLHPGTHTVDIKYISKPERGDTVSVALTTEVEGLVKIVDDGTRMFGLDDVINGKHVSGAKVSATGKYLLASYSDVDNETSRSYQKLYDLKTGKPLYTLKEWAIWMPKGDRYYVSRSDYDNGRHIVVVDLADGSEQIIASHLPKGRFYFSPSEDFLVFTLEREGDKEDAEVYQILEPDDRQPGWRTRSYAAIYPIGGNGQLMPLTTGSENAYVADITKDGKRALLMTSKSRLAKRPTTVATLLEIDLATFKADTLVLDDGFIASAQYSPDGKKVLVTGTPEAFDRIGCILPDSVTPSMIQEELFVIDLADKRVKPITKDFYPNPQNADWAADGMVYVLCENRDMYTLYKIDPATAKFSEVEIPEQIIQNFDIAADAPVMAFVAQSDSNPDRLYVQNMRNGKLQMLDSPSAKRYEDVRVTNVQDWNFTNSKGDTIYGRYYLPDNFDPEKKYPMIVYYYGGCSPTDRRFASYYPFQVYAALGYVVYVVQPSGATGFGQEFSSRHVATAGEGPAQDIIEGTKLFAEEHPFVDASKIGCLGASYGGFMTQYLQTITDIFAAAISHAGISDHTSYWGEGYWGYSYSETSMGDAKPWNRKDLYVDRSPLYNADKVQTPILFLHGDADTNVPVGESIQMFTALKLLGKETALVLVKEQDHHILQLSKRRKWQDTIFAWFAKYLQDDPTWWDELYPAKGL